MMKNINKRKRQTKRHRKKWKQKKISLREDFDKKNEKRIITKKTYVHIIKKNTNTYNKNRLSMNAVYSSNEVLLRVLILNDMNALDKIKYVSLPNPEVLEKDKKLKNVNMPNPDEKMFIIRDTGIWMIKDVVNNLGTIAQSGTKKFIEIGQFDFGFYRAYLVSKRVVVRIESKRSKNKNEDEQHVWKSTASGACRVRNDSDNPYLTKRGTEIYLKNDCANFCKEKTVKIVKKHSQFVFQINSLTSKEEK
ncbi:hypothetical protein RFI_32310, partial [Reticulomyxa filosa]